MRRALSTAVALLISCFLAACARRETPVEAGNRDQVLHRGVGYEVTGLDPDLETGIAEQTILSALFEGLVAEDPHDLHPIPGVARSWEASPDGLTYTFFLRPEARWSNGAPVTAGDFVQSWHRALAPSLGAGYADMLFVLKGAESFHRGESTDFGSVGARAADPRTLIVTLDHRTPDFLSRLTHWIWSPVYLPAIAANGSPYDRGNPWTHSPHFIGDGPFMLGSWVPGREIVVERSPTYWDSGNVRLREIHFYPIDSLDAEETAFRTGQLHITDAIPFERIEDYRRESPTPLRIDRYLATEYYCLNLRRPPFQDPRVRKALELAVDRRALVEHVLRGGQATASAFTPPGIGDYAPPGGLRTDFDEARRLLAESGHPGGRGLPPLKLLFNNSENRRLLAEAVQEMWRKELGVEVLLFNEENKVFLASRTAGDFDIVRGDWVADYLDPSTFLDVWRSDSGNNYSGWSNPKYDALLDRAERATGATERNELFGKAEAILLDSIPIIPIYHYTHVFLIQPSVRGWYPTLLDHHPYKFVWLD